VTGKARPSMTEDAAERARRGMEAVPAQKSRRVLVTVGSVCSATPFIAAVKQ
jgi:hypothetical protein